MRAFSYFSGVAFGSLVCAALLGSVAPAPAQGGGGQPLEPQLVGTWYWEASNYVSAGDHSTLIKTVRWVKIYPDGQFSYVQQGTHGGNITMTGHVEKTGNLLRVFPKTGQPFNVTYKLSGSNGLWLNGQLYEKK